MGGFFGRLFRRQPSPKILLLGLDSAGKTTILLRLKHGKEAKTKATEPTIGFNVETVKVNKIELSVWDVGGQDKLRNFWRHYYKGVSCIIFVVDSNDHQRFEKAKEEIHKLTAEVTLRGVPILVLANKQDLPEACSPGQLKENLDLSKLTVKHRVIGCTATDGLGIHDAMTWVEEHMHRY